jgi:hypothetical protein
MSPEGGATMLYAEIWTFQLGPSVKLRDLEGFEVQATDGSIGKVDRATDEAGGSFIVVDTGPWIFGRKVVIPAGAIERVDVDNRVVRVAMTKDEIKRSPVFDAERGWDEDYRRQFDTYFGGLRKAS